VCSQYQKQFAFWVKARGKAYDGPEELFKRLSIFSANLDLIHKHNAEEEAGLHSFRLAANDFADMTNEEYRAKLLSLRRGRSPRAAAAAGTFDTSRVGAPLPPSVDWRTQKAINPIKNQGDCGSCCKFCTHGCWTVGG
jgi:C1A family cysteine protease